MRACAPRRTDDVVEREVQLVGAVHARVQRDPLLDLESPSNTARSAAKPAASASTSVRNPSRPVLTPRISMPRGCARRAPRSSVPSPPIVISSSASSTSQVGAKPSAVAGPVVAAERDRDAAPRARSGRPRARSPPPAAGSG